MHHFLLTRAVYAPKDWKLDANRRRLAVFAGITVPSLAAQTCRDWEWLIAIHPDDHLLEERKAVAMMAGVPTRFIPVIPRQTSRAAVALEAYQARWREHLPREDLLTTRLDDDDAFAVDAFQRLHEAVEANRKDRTVFLFPWGYRAWGNRCTSVWHGSNAMSSLYLTNWHNDLATIYDFRHRQVRRHVPIVRFIDERPGWLWVRHDDTLSGWHRAEQPITEEIRTLFPVNWTLLEQRKVPQQPGGDRFA